MLGFSRPYIQAVELGTRPPTHQLASKVMIMTGAAADCIYPASDKAVGLNGKPYSKKTYKEYTNPNPKPKSMTNAQWLPIITRLNDVVNQAAGIDKVALVTVLIEDQLEQCHKALIQAATARK